MAKLVQKFYLSRDSGISWLENEQTKMGFQMMFLGFLTVQVFHGKIWKLQWLMDYCLMIF